MIRLWKQLWWFWSGLAMLCALNLAYAVGAPAVKPVAVQSLKIAISNDSYPYMYLDKQDQPAGLVVDWWQALAEPAGVQLEFITVDWANIFQLLDSGAVDVIGGLAITPPRQQKYLFGPVMADVYSNVFVHRDLQQLSELNQLQPHVIGVVKNSGHLAFIRQHLPALYLREFDHTSAMYDAALSGDIKAFISLDRLTPRYRQYSLLNQLYPLYKKLPLQKIALTYAVPTSQPELAAELQRLAAAMAPDLADKLQRRWLSGISSDETLVLSMSVANQPLMNVSITGVPQGLLVDLWQLWSEKTGTPIAIVPDPSSAGLKSLAQGRVDIHMGYPSQPDQHAEVRSAHEIYHFSSSFYYPKNYPLRQFSEVGLPVGVFATASYRQQLLQQYPGLQLRTFAKFEEILHALERKDIAGFFAADLLMQQYELQLQSYGLRQLDFPRFSSPMHVLVRKDNSLLEKKIRQGFASMTQEELENIERRWLPSLNMGYFAKFRQHVSLTEVEQQWLTSQTELRVGVLANWAPMEFVDTDGQVRGVTADILQKLNQRLGANFVAVPYQEWSALEQAFKAGELDLVANMSELPERHQFANFSHNFWPLQWTLISHNSTQDINLLAELTGYKVAVLKDYQIVRYFRQHYPQVQLVFTDSLQQGIDLLKRGEVSFVVDTMVLSGRALRQSENSNLRLHLPADMPTYPTLFAVRKDAVELLNLLNKGLKTLTENDRTEILNRWFSIEIRQGVEREQVVTLVLQVIGIGGFLLLLVFFWNLSLRREISLRRAIEQKMRFMATHDDLTQLANRNLLKERLTQALHQHARHQEKLALLFLDLDGFKAVNDQFGHHVGDELLIKVAAVLQHCVRKSDTVARFGGDEFVILLTSLLDKDDAAIVAEKILLHLEQPILLSACQAKVGVSIGIALYPDDATDSGQMMQIADSLMYSAKQQGKGCYRFSEAGIPTQGQ
jgi:diguanylate cyclase (GGDEF)-like protein